MREFLDSVPEFLHLVQVPGRFARIGDGTQMSSAESGNNSKFAHNYFLECILLLISNGDLVGLRCGYYTFV